MTGPWRIIRSTVNRWLPAAAALLVSATAWGAGDFPRLADGRPDLNGVWQVLNTANYDVRPHDARAALMLVEGPAGPVPAPQLAPLGAVGMVPAGPGVVEGGEIPYQGWAFERQQENQRDWLNRDPEIRCFLPGVPRAHYMPYPFQIVQGSGSLYFAYEYAGAVRNVHLTDPGPPSRPSWMGQSVAHWEGDTLVIVVSGFNGRTWLDRAGNFHSDALIVTERFTPTSAYTLEYQATLEDIKVYTRPWTMRMTLYRRVGEDARIEPLKCAAFVEELIYGHLRQEP